MTNNPLENETPVFDRAAPADGSIVAHDEMVEAEHVNDIRAEECYPGVHIPSYGTGSGSSADSAAGSASGGAEQAKGAARDLAGDTKDAGAHVTGVAKEQASRVASEATDHARQLFGQASEGLKEQAGEQQQRAAGGLRNISEQLSSMADAADDGIAQKVVRDLSHRAGTLGTYLEGRDPGSLLHEVRSFAARRPGTFIAVAAGAGILAGRLTKALTAEIKHEKESGTDGTGVGA
jgi:hypothetical protein